MGLALVSSEGCIIVYEENIVKVVHIFMRNYDRNDVLWC